jgi:hypothetical protein
MVKVPYRGVPKKDTVEPTAPEPPIRRGEVKGEGEGEAAQGAGPPIRRAEKIGDGSNG